MLLTYAVAMLAQRRVMVALQNLLVEVAHAEGQPPPPPLQAHTGLGQLLMPGLVGKHLAGTAAGSGSSAVNNTRRSASASASSTGAAARGSVGRSSLAMSVSRDTSVGAAGARGSFTFLSASSQQSGVTTRHSDSGMKSMGNLPHPPGSQFKHYPHPDQQPLDFTLHGVKAAYGAGLYKETSDTPAPYHTPMMAGLSSQVGTAMGTQAQLQQQGDTVVKAGAWADSKGMAG